MVQTRSCRDQIYSYQVHALLWHCLELEWPRQRVWGDLKTLNT